MSVPGAAKPGTASRQTRVNQRVLLPLVVGGALLLGMLYAWPRSRQLLQRPGRELLDEFHVHGRKTAPRDDIVILAIDDASLTVSSAFEDDLAAVPVLRDMKGQFPWHRRVWAQVIDKLADAGAKIIFLDLAFIGEAPDPQDDDILRECLARHQGKVIIGAKFDDTNIHGGGTVDFFYPNKSATGTNVPADGTWGFLNFWPEPDGIVRRARFHTTRWKIEKEQEPDSVPDPDELSKPSVALAIARRVNASASADVAENVRLRFCPAGAYEPLSLHQIFVPALWDSVPFNKGALFKDKIVMVGATAQELQDTQRIPEGTIAGVQLHAHALSALLAHSFITEAPGSWLWFSLIAGAGVAWLLVTFVRQPVFSLVIMWLATIGGGYACFVAFNKLGIEISPVPFALALNGCGVLGLTGNFLSQLRESRKLMRIVQRHHSPDHVAAMLKNREGLFHTMGGVERSVTILFSDIRGYTTLSEGMKPDQLVTQLNEYLSKMVERVFIHHGSIDKFIGDAVMALWGSMRDGTAENSLRADAQHAVTSALAMRDSLAQLNANWRDRGVPELRIGIGIHQGPVVVGYIGSAAPHEHMELTVIGDSVNLASRLEGITKDYACDIIVSDAVQQHIRATHLCRPLDIVKVKGKAIPVKIYFVEGPREGREEPAWWNICEEAIEALNDGRKEEARTRFEQCRSQAPHDAILAKLLGRCA